MEKPRYNAFEVATISGRKFSFVFVNDSIVIFDTTKIPYELTTKTNFTYTTKTAAENYEEIFNDAMQGKSFLGEVEYDVEFLGYVDPQDNFEPIEFT